MNDGEQRRRCGCCGHSQLSIQSSDRNGYDPGNTQMLTIKYTGEHHIAENKTKDFVLVMFSASKSVDGLSPLLAVVEPPPRESGGGRAMEPEAPRRRPNRL